MSDELKAYKGCTLILVTILNGIATIPWHGWVLSTVWGWFIVPLGLEPLGIAHAAGVAVVSRMLVYFDTGRKADDDELYRMMVGCWLRPALALAFGWAIYSVM